MASSDRDRLSAGAHAALDRSSTSNQAATAPHMDLSGTGAHTKVHLTYSAPVDAVRS